MIPAYHAAFHFVTHNLLSTLFHSWCSHTFAFLFQLVLASVLVSIFQCDVVERFGPKYLVAGYLGWPLGRNRSTGAFSQIRIPEARGRWAPGARLQQGLLGVATISRIEHILPLAVLADSHGPTLR